MMRKFLLGLMVCCGFMLAQLVYAVPVLKVNVELHGIKDETLANNIRAHLDINQAELEQDLSVFRLQELFHQSNDEIKSALAPFGYYEPSIQSSLKQLNDKNWLARYSIKLGPVIKIAQIDLEIIGISNKIIRDYFAEMPFKKGDPLNQAAYEEFKDEAQRTAYELGYFDAHFTTKRLEIDRKKHICNIILHFALGERYKFGQIKIEKSPLNEDFIRRFIPFKAGDFFDHKEVVQLQNDINNTTYFSEVNVIPRHDKIKDAQIPLDIHLKSRKRFQYSIGLGYGNDTGYRSRVGWHVRHVNPAGHQFGTEIYLAQYRNRITARYLIPGHKPRIDNYFITAGYTDERPDNRKLKSSRYELGLSQIHITQPHWQRISQLNYQYERYKKRGSRTTEASLLIPGISFEYTNSNHPFNPDYGYKIQWQIQGTNELLLSTTHFIQSELTATWLQPITERTRIRIRSNVGATILESLEELPPSLRFYAGGFDSVRGYAYHSLGPRIVDDNKNVHVTGAQNVFTANFEYQFPLYKIINGVFFYDIGNALKKFGDPLKESAGIGIRINTPVGALRLDYAKPIDDGNKDWRIHFSLGPEL